MPPPAVPFVSPLSPRGGGGPDEAVAPPRRPRRGTSGETDGKAERWTDKPTDTGRQTERWKIRKRERQIH